MRVFSLLCSMALVATLVLVQNSSKQSGMLMAQGSQSSGMQGMQGMEGMSGMHDEMMTSMQADLDSMSTNLLKMKDQVSKVSDESSKNAMLLNIDMWQSLIDHSNKHMAMMKEMMESKPGMMPGK